jgi:hypothetical protein
VVGKWTKYVEQESSLISRVASGSLAGIGKLLALAGRYIRLVFCVL